MASKTVTKSLSETFKNRLAERNNIPIPGEGFQKELEQLCNEIGEWKNKLKTSTATQLAAKLGKRPDFSSAATGENIKKFLTDETGKNHLKILKKDPETYASRIAVVMSTMRKGSGLDDQIMRKILIQAAAGNYNTETKVDKELVDNISSVNLKVVLRAQALYFDAYIQECKEAVGNLRQKVGGRKDDIYKQQQIQITRLTEKIQANAKIIYEYKLHAMKKEPTDKEKNVAYTQDVVLNLNEFNQNSLDEKRFRLLIQMVYNLIRIIRGATLLYPLGHRIADKVIQYGKFQGEDHPVGYYFKAQLYGDEYMLAFKGMERSQYGEKEYYATKLVDAFKALANHYTLAYGKVNKQTDKKLQMAIALDFAEYLINFCEVHQKFLVDILQMNRLSKEWLNPLLSKAKNGLIALDGSNRVEELYLKLENIGSGAEMGSASSKI